jgi:hypothetical protein
MKKDDYDIQNQPSARLVEVFELLAIAKGNAILGGETAKASRLYWKIDAVVSALKSRPGDERRLLAHLHQHVDPSVRLEAATATLATDLEASRRVLALIWEDHEFPFAGDVGMRLHHLDIGFYRPT